MKKITLFFLIIFIIITGYIYSYNLLFPLNADKTFISKIFQTNSGKGLVLCQNEVSKHSTPNDCYIIINNNIYNISSYINSHPGGRESIISHCGKEVTGIFSKIHSNKAWDLLINYKIGTLAKQK